MDQMTISGHWIINATSVGNTKWCSKSVATCMSMLPSAMMICAYSYAKVSKCFLL